MALENNLVVDSDAELKAFLSSILSSEGIVVNINRTFIAYNNGTNRNRVFARCANRMAQKGTDEKFVVIALMCYPALNWILKARDIDAMIEQLHDMDTDGSVRNISEIQSLLENSTGYVKPRLHLEMRKLFFARCQQLVDAVDDAMNRAVFRSAQPCKPARISLAMAMLRGSILDSDPVSAVMIRNNFDGIIEDIAKVGGEAIKELVLQLAPNEGVVQGAEAAYLYHNTEVLLREYSRITHPSSVDGNSTLRLIATAGNQLDASDHKSDARYAQAPPVYDGVNGVLTAVTGHQVGVPPVSENGDNDVITPQPTVNQPASGSTDTTSNEVNKVLGDIDMSGDATIEFYATVKTADGREYKVPLSTANLTDGTLTALLDSGGYPLTQNAQ